MDDEDNIKTRGAYVFLGFMLGMLFAGCICVAALWEFP